jgi:hypothetical protein
MLAGGVSSVDVYAMFQDVFSQSNILQAAPAVRHNRNSSLKHESFFHLANFFAGRRLRFLDYSSAWN